MMMIYYIISFFKTELPFYITKSSTFVPLCKGLLGGMNSQIGTKENIP